MTSERMQTIYTSLRFTTCLSISVDFLPATGRAVPSPRKQGAPRTSTLPPVKQRTNQMPEHTHHRQCLPTREANGCLMMIIMINTRRTISFAGSPAVEKFSLMRRTWRSISQRSIAYFSIAVPFPTVVAHLKRGTVAEG